MKALRNISIKRFLTFVIWGLVALLAVLSTNDLVKTYGRSREISRVSLANELSDRVLAASGLQAKERGMTAMSLNLDTPADAATIQGIAEVRTKGDTEFKKAASIAAELLGGIDSSNIVLREVLDRAAQLHAELESARRNVDRNISRTERDYPSAQWFRLITAFIDANAEMRLAAFTSAESVDTHQEALRLNIELKHAVWLVGEYAGRERATLADFISARRPVDRSTLERLNTYRAIVDLNMKTILRLKAASGADAKALSSISRMEEVFLGSFEGVRRSVYEAAPGGSYPLGGKEWIAKSSEAIDTILDVSASVGKMVDAKVNSALLSAKKSLAYSAVFLALIVCAGLSSAWVVRYKILSPVLYLNAKMNEVEKTGDLTVNIRIDGTDENAQMAASFNAMISRLRAIIREIHSSTEQLASSSEQLSASATQIAGGTKAQSAKAAQVSTSSQEMSTTLVEVAKNVSSAAEAAREANGVAVKGGGIVAKTIESMNGIADTAKASSSIISSLGTRSKEIGNIIGVIDDIADQTNLLALNAAIEAARAGEQGRGFAVVADEVRKLAEKTQTATKEISAMIKTMQDETGRAIESMENEVRSVDSGVELAKDAGAALSEIVTKVDVVTQMVHQITVAMEEQSAATEQISGDIEAVAGVINETTVSAQQIAGASTEMSRLAARLKASVGMFRVSTQRQFGEDSAVEQIETAPSAYPALAD